MDPVSTLLDRLQWTVTGYTRHELTAGVDQRFTGTESRLHYLRCGAVTVTGADRAQRMMAGDLILTLRGGDHAVRVVPSPAHPGALLLSATLAAAGAGDPVADRLPALLITCGFDAREPLVAPLLEQLESEVSGGRPGASVLASRLASLVAASAVRTWVESGCDLAGWHRAAVDPDIARAAAAVHEDPGAPWTVESLARVAHTSRSAFAARFQEIVGEPPVRYVGRVRMERAKVMLARDGATVARTALALGYGSEAAFSRAFRRIIGDPPSAWRASA